MTKKNEPSENNEAVQDEPVLGCVDGLSHVERTVMAISEEELKASRKEIMKNSETIKTGFGDIILIKHPRFNAP